MITINIITLFNYYFNLFFFSAEHRFILKLFLIFIFNMIIKTLKITIFKIN